MDVENPAIRHGLWRPHSSLSDPQSILIVKPGSFGDVIHTLPCATALRARFPAARITWLVDSRWESLLDGNPSIDARIAFPRESFHGFSGTLRALPWAAGLRVLRPDVALDLQGLLRSALMARISRARQTYGLSDAREGARWFHQKVVPVPPGEHAVRRYLRSLTALGLPPVSTPEFPLPPGKLPPSVHSTPPDILLHPFARGSGKSLTSQQVHNFCRALRPRRILLAGRGNLKGTLPDNVVNLLNQTSLAEMIGLIRAAALVVSVDSGPMHIAAAVNSRLLSIHTWSDPRLVGPFNENAHIWQGGEIRPQRLGATALPPARTPTDADILRMAGWARERT